MKRMILGDISRTMCLANTLTFSGAIGTMIISGWLDMLRRMISQEKKSGFGVCLDKE